MMGFRDNCGRLQKSRFLLKPAQTIDKVSG